MSSNTKRRTNKSSSSRKSNKTQSATNSILKEILLLNKQQTNKDLPEVTDVPRMRLKRQAVHSFTCSLDMGNLSYPTTVPTGTSYSFTLSQLPNAIEYQSLFDQYRICQINMEFIPEIMQSGVATTMYPPIYSVIDYDDANVSTNITDYLQYDSFMAVAGGTYFERTFNPQASVDVYSGIIASGFASAPRNLWIDVASSGVSYYGLKVLVGVASAAGSACRVISHFVIQCRNTR